MMAIAKKYEGGTDLSGNKLSKGFLINGEVRLIIYENNKPKLTIRYNKSDGIIKKPSWN